MKVSVWFEPEAEAELMAAAQWFKAQLPGLELRFLDAVDDTISAIQLMPRGFQVLKGSVRHIPVKVFPFVVVYALDKEVIVVLSVFHTSRTRETRACRIEVVGDQRTAAHVRPGFLIRSVDRAAR